MIKNLFVKEKYCLLLFQVAIRRCLSFELDRAAFFVALFCVRRHDCAEILVKYCSGLKELLDGF